MIKNNNLDNNIIQKSPAKINLFLEVLGKNTNNFHFINSLIILIDIYDQIEIQKSDKFILEIIDSKNNKLILNSENIIKKTVQILSKKYNFIPNIKIILTKNIPIGAGLGGGSSNAATIIHMINDIFNLNISHKEMMDIGLKIGCDIPFFLNKSHSIVSGIGEKIENIEIRDELYLLLIYPNKELCTKDVFDHCYFKKKLPFNNMYDLIDLIKNKNNDLENSAIEICPEIANILKELRLQKNIITAKMSGSGSSCFGLFKNKYNLNESYEYMKNKFNNYFIKIVKNINVNSQ